MCRQISCPVLPLIDGAPELPILLNRPTLRYGTSQLMRYLARSSMFQQVKVEESHSSVHIGISYLACPRAGASDDVLAECTAGMFRAQLLLTIQL